MYWSDGVCRWWLCSFQCHRCTGAAPHSCCSVTLSLGSGLPRESVKGRRVINCRWSVTSKVLHVTWHMTQKWTLLCHLNGHGKVLVFLKVTNVLLKVCHAYCKGTVDKPGSTRFMTLSPKGESHVTGLGDTRRSSTISGNSPHRWKFPPETAQCTLNTLYTTLYTIHCTLHYTMYTV